MGDRKARLASLAARAGRTKQPTNSEEDGGANDDHDRQGNGELSNSSEMQADTTTKQKPLVAFRNYTPKDASLDAANQEDDDIGEDADHSSSDPPSKRQRTSADSAPVEKKPPSSLAETLAKAQREISHITSATIATSGGTTAAPVDIKAIGPEKINGDLKRGIQDKLAKLERRTQKVIVELLKERLEREASLEVGEDDNEDGNALD